MEVTPIHFSNVKVGDVLLLVHSYTSLGRSLSTRWLICCTETGNELYYIRGYYCPIVSSGQFCDYDAHHSWSHTSFIPEYNNSLFLLKRL